MRSVFVSLVEKQSVPGEIGSWL